MIISKFIDWDNGTNPEFVDLRVYIQRDANATEWEFTVTLYRDDGRIAFDGVRCSDNNEPMEATNEPVPTDIMEAFDSVKPAMIAQLEAIK